MFHRKNVKLAGIRMQMTVGLLAIFFVSGIILYEMTSWQLEKSRQEQIIRELQGIQENTKLYVRQLLILNGANNDEESFEELASSIVQELYASNRYELAAYSRDGELQAASIRLKMGGKLESGTQTGDFQEALEGNAAFTMVYTDANMLEVWFSMPVIVAEKNIGLLRYYMDYSELYQQSREIEGMILRIAAAVFVAAFFLIFLLLNRMLRPIQRLSRVSRLMTMDLEQNQVNTDLLAGLADSRRRDEIGELSRDYSTMLTKTGEYIQKMEDDKAQILSLLDSRQEFYNNVTHELKTPLTTIQGYAQLIEADQGADLELTQKGIRHILHESTRLHRMVLQLLEMADHGREEPFSPVDMGALIRNVAEAMEIKAKRYGNHILLRLEANLTVWGQEERLRQVFINLIDNAVKYTEAGTEIRIYGEQREQGKLLFSVLNKGKQMPEVELRHIFEPFYRVDKELSREQGSAGLGLPICRKIMKEHGGKIWAENRLQGEICFFVLFPPMPERSRNV